MITALQKDEALINDIKSSAREVDQLRLWWLGQSGFLLQWNKKHILLDPYLSDALTYKYQNTDKPHVRMSEKVLSPGSLDFIDIVTSSHNHTDHLDRETLLPILKINPDIKLIIPEANRAFVADRLTCSVDFPIGLNDEESIMIDNIIVHGIAAAHNELDRDDNGKCKYMGYVVQLGQYTIYHSGDTLWHDDIIDQVKKFNIDLALLPINGNLPERRVAGNLNAREAVAFAKEINAGVVIPCHYHMFEFNTVDPDQFIQIAQEKGQKYKVLEPGGTFNLPDD